MAVYTLTRYPIRPDAFAEAERAMHEAATWIRKELPDATWTVYRSLTHYAALGRAETAAAEQRRRDSAGMRTLEAALAPLLAGPVEVSEYELVTSSDLAPRHRRR